MGGCSGFSRHKTATLRHVSDIGAGQELSWAERGHQATAALVDTWGSLAEACQDLTAHDWALATECPGWDVKDQLSHLIGIERMIMGEATPVVDAHLGDHVKSDFGAMNEPWIVVRRPLAGDEVLAEFVEVTGQRLRQLEDLTDEEWDVVGFSPVGPAPFGRFMETRVFDSWTHEQDVRRALGRPGGEGGLASGFGLGQVESAMGFVVGKKAQAPEGSVTRFVVSGAPGDAREFAVTVRDGRAQPAEGSPAADVTLRLSSSNFLRLGCGRVTSAELEAAGEIGVEGDSALGQAVLSSMSFMF
jgi:uncharacterized protein (TIGR03083 family)